MEINPPQSLLEVLAAVLAPTLLLHEWTHAAAARLLDARGVSVGISTWQASWPSETPEWRVRVAHLAPSLLSVLVAPVVAAALLALPVYAWPYTLLLFVVYAWPSYTDRHPDVVVKDS